MKAIMQKYVTSVFVTFFGNVTLISDMASIFFIVVRGTDYLLHLTRLDISSIKMDNILKLQRTLKISLLKVHLFTEQGSLKKQKQFTRTFQAKREDTILPMPW